MNRQRADILIREVGPGGVPGLAAMVGAPHSPCRRSGKELVRIVRIDHQRGHAPGIVEGTGFVPGQATHVLKLIAILPEFLEVQWRRIAKRLSGAPAEPLPAVVMLRLGPRRTSR